jgi:ERF superfamily protein
MVQKTERSGREVLDAIELSLKKLTEQTATNNNVGTPVVPIRKRESDDTRELYKALHTAQRAFKGVEKSGFINGRNIPYAKINDLIDASRAALHANNLVVSTYHVISQNSSAALVTRLYHFPSGQFIESELPLLNGTDEQKRGSSVTYAWRYTYAPLIGLVDTSYDDDAEVTKR